MVGPPPSTRGFFMTEADLASRASMPPPPPPPLQHPHISHRPPTRTFLPSTSLTARIMPPPPPHPYPSIPPPPISHDLRRPRRDLVYHDEYSWSDGGDSDPDEAERDAYTRRERREVWPTRVSGTRASASGARWEGRLDAGTVGGFGRLPRRRRVSWEGGRGKGEGSDGDGDGDSGADGDGRVDERVLERFGRIRVPPGLALAAARRANGTGRDSGEIENEDGDGDEDEGRAGLRELEQRAYGYVNYAEMGRYGYVNGRPVYPPPGYQPTTPIAHPLLDADGERIRYQPRPGPRKSTQYWVDREDGRREDEDDDEERTRRGIRRRETRNKNARKYQATVEDYYGSEWEDAAVVKDGGDWPNGESLPQVADQGMTETGKEPNQASLCNSGDEKEREIHVTVDETTSAAEQHISKAVHDSAGSDQSDRMVRNAVAEAEQESSEGEDDIARRSIWLGW